MDKLTPREPSEAERLAQALTDWKSREVRDLDRLDAAAELRRLAALSESNAAAAHAQGLRERIAELEAQRVPLTKAEITACCNESDTYKTGVWMRVHETTLERLVRAIERAHGIEEAKR